MRPRLLTSVSLDTQEHNALRATLDQFYARSIEYSPFHAPSDQRQCWDHVLTEINTRLLSGFQGKLQVAEIGAGRTGFAKMLVGAGIRDRVQFHAQDVTEANADWLKDEADAVYIGDVHECGLVTGMDIIFSTYVFEHVTNPLHHLNVLWHLLAARADVHGSLFIFSPRYDFPGYICPSTRHLHSAQKLRFAMKAFYMRVCACFFGRPAFLIQTDLAAFHCPFFVDSDAVHWVSLFDIRAWAASCGAAVKVLRIGNPQKFTKDWFVKRFCTVAVKVDQLKPLSRIESEGSNGIGNSQC